MKKILLIIVLIPIILIGVVFVSRDRIASRMIHDALVKASGTEVQLEGVSVSIRRRKVSIERLLFKNPPKYKKEVLADVRNVQLFLGSKLWDKSTGFQFERVLISFHKLQIEKNAMGETNVGSLKAFSDEFLGDTVTSAHLLIQHLEFQMGRIAFSESVQGVQEMENMEVDLKGRVERVSHVTDLYALIQIPFVKAIENLNKGSLGLPRGKILERLERMSNGTK